MKELNLRDPVLFLLNEFRKQIQIFEDEEDKQVIFIFTNKIVYEGFRPYIPLLKSLMLPVLNLEGKYKNWEVRTMMIAE